MKGLIDITKKTISFVLVDYKNLTLDETPLDIPVTNCSQLLRSTGAAIVEGVTGPPNSCDLAASMKP